MAIVVFWSISWHRSTIRKIMTKLSRYCDNRLDRYKSLIGEVLFFYGMLYVLVQYSLL